MTASKASQSIRKLGHPTKAKFLQGFFKTGKGQYAEGDVFIGVTVPETRAIAKQFIELPLSEVSKLLKSKIHEERLLALMILVLQFEKGDEKHQEKVFNHYIKHKKHINNWDLVDLSAYKIVGPHLEKKDRSLFRKLSKSKIMWDRRIAIVGSFHYIRQNDFKETLWLSERYLSDKEDLMHKATGWMLREVGKRDGKVLRQFLDKHVTRMPRTMLRYAIEKFPEKERKAYLKVQ